MCGHTKTVGMGTNRVFLSQQPDKRFRFRFRCMMMKRAHTFNAGNVSLISDLERKYVIKWLHIIFIYVLMQCKYNFKTKLKGQS